MDASLTPAEPPRPSTIPVDRRVIVTDVDMPFGSMILFMFKWALAAIPAALLVLIVCGVLFGMLGGVLVALSPFTH